ncbi:MAG TPA: hypothetical protein VI934_00395 [Candidatus Nanoarchaeia archaeon]|nr:hypothetical protein [Candidatus Nanoarchaeia archaeon]
MNIVCETETFSKLYDAAEKSEREWIDGIKDHLMENLRVGKPLRYDWFREKKLGVKRLFYLFNHKTNKAVIVAFGNKKEQQKIINHILSNKERYLKLIE